MPNKNLARAFKARVDEFYTTMEEVEQEMRHYRDQFRGAVIYCNCDDYRRSNFVKYFRKNFNNLGLTKLISSHLRAINTSLFEKMPDATHAEFDALGETYTPIRGSGCFSSPECTAIMERADIVITNPPFSHIKRYIRHLVYHKKKFLVMSTLPAVATAQMVGLIQDGLMGIGYSMGAKWFHVPEELIYPETTTKMVEGKTAVAIPNAVWLTNLSVKRKRHIPTKPYNPEEHPKYDNYDAINIDRVADIPMNYPGKMGVPVSFLRYDLSEFSIISFHGQEPGKERDDLRVNGEMLFARIIIQRTNTKAA